MYREDYDLNVRLLLADSTQTNPEDWYLVFKARYGMARVFDTIARAGRGSRVLTQAYTCVTAVTPIIQAGLTPKYVDIDPSTLMANPDLLSSNEQIACTVMQHTFGIMNNEKNVEFAEKTRSLGALLIEDSAQCVGEMARNQNQEPLADVSIHSFGIEKVLPTRFGGAVWVNPEMQDQDLRDQIRSALDGLEDTSGWKSTIAHTYVNQNRVLNRLPRRWNQSTRRALESGKLFEPPISKQEFRAEQPQAPSRPTNWINKLAESALLELADVRQRRGDVTRTYLDELNSEVVASVQSVNGNQPLIWFPLVTESEASACELYEYLSKRGAYVTRWGWPLLFPGVSDEAKFGIENAEQTLPVTYDLARRIVSVQTNVGVERAKEIAGFVNDWKRGSSRSEDRSEKSLAIANEAGEMQLEFRQLEDAEYQQFLTTQDRVYLTQLVAYGDARAADGAKVDRVGLVVNGDVVGACTVIYEPWKKVFKRAVVLFGPLLDYSNPLLTKAFMSSLKRWVGADPRVLSIRVNPYVLRRHYSGETPGDELPIATSIDEAMEEVGGLKVSGEFYDDFGIQPRFMYSKDLNGLAHKEAISSTGNNVRAGIRKAKSSGVEVEYLSSDDFDVIQPILDHTAERTGMPFVSPEVLDRYRRMMDQMGTDQFVFPAAILDTPKALASIDHELQIIGPKLQKLQDMAVEAESQGRELSKKQRNQRNELETRQEALIRRQKQTEEVQKERGDRVVLAASLFIETPTEMIFHHSGGYSDLDDYRGIYAIHDAMVERAISKGLRWYNMNAITGRFEEGAPGYGVFDFKRNFHGEVEESVGSYDLPLHPWLAQKLGAV